MLQNACALFGVPSYASGGEPNVLGVAAVVVAAVDVDMVLVFAGAFPLLVDAMVTAGGAIELQVVVDVGN